MKITYQLYKFRKKWSYFPLVSAYQKPFMGMLLLLQSIKICHIGINKIAKRDITFHHSDTALAH